MGGLQVEVVGRNVGRGCKESAEREKGLNALLWMCVSSCIVCMEMGVVLYMYM